MNNTAIFNEKIMDITGYFDKMMKSMAFFALYFLEHGNG